MGDVDVAHVDPAPLQPAEALAREDVERTGEDDEAGRRVADVALEALQCDVRTAADRDPCGS